MGKLTKNQKAAIAKYDAAKEYKLAEACELVKEITYTKFDASVELHVNHLVSLTWVNTEVYMKLY